MFIVRKVFGGEVLVIDFEMTEFQFEKEFFEMDKRSEIYAPSELLM